MIEYAGSDQGMGKLQQDRAGPDCPPCIIRQPGGQRCPSRHCHDAPEAPATVTIAVASEVGRGTTFVIDFPRTQARAIALVAG